MKKFRTYRTTRKSTQRKKEKAFSERVRKIRTQIVLFQRTPILEIRTSYSL